MKTTVSSKGQIVLPAELREADGIRPGQQFTIERLEEGQYMLRKIELPERTGTTAWLARCPAKDWFVKMPSESTDTL